MKSFFFLWITLFLPIEANAGILEYFANIKQDPNALYAFLKEMPKGGELHYHLAGGAYPENMLRLAETHHYCLGAQETITQKSPCQDKNSTTLEASRMRYETIIRAWSMKDFIPGGESGHDHFFNSFLKFLPIVNDFHPELLAEIMQRAANQNELYLEIMILPDNADSSAFASLIHAKKTLAGKKQKLLASAEFQKIIHHTAFESSRILKKARKQLGCNSTSPKAACALTVAFQYYVLREQPLDSVFAQALNGFAAVSLSKDLVGINLVQAEDGIISLRDYKKQMHIFQFLHKAYPNVHITLHAGELAPSAVIPKDLRFHIRDAIFLGHAERIGHGVDIAYEDNAEVLLKYMAKAPIPVEINLTSNRHILNVSGKRHPLRYYLTHHVPVVLSTDDEGILRTDLTREYLEAVLTYGLGYQDIKTINRNALTYSFLPGKSLWINPNKGIPVVECQKLTSKACREFIKDEKKATLQWRLEKELSTFENRFRV